MENEEDFLAHKAETEWQKQEEEQKKYDEHEKYLESLSDEDVDELRAEDEERRKQNRINREFLKDKGQKYDPYGAYKINDTD